MGVCGAESSAGLIAGLFNCFMVKWLNRSGAGENCSIVLWLNGWIEAEKRVLCVLCVSFACFAIHVRLHHTGRLNVFAQNHQQ